jgi:hypothetical protein
VKRTLFLAWGRDPVSKVTSQTEKACESARAPEVMTSATCIAHSEVGTHARMSNQTRLMREIVIMADIFISSLSLIDANVAMRCDASRRI